MYPAYSTDSTLSSADFVTVEVPGDSTSGVLLQMAQEVFPPEISWTRQPGSGSFRVTTTPRAYLFFLGLTRPPVFWPPTSAMTQGEFQFKALL